MTGTGTLFTGFVVTCQQGLGEQLVRWAWRRRLNWKRGQPITAGLFSLLAEGVGFEPTVPCGTTDFESVTFDLSDTPPHEAEPAPRLPHPGKRLILSFFPGAQRLEKTA